MARDNGPDKLADIAMDTFEDYIELNFCAVLNKHTSDEMLPSKISLFQNKCEILKRFVKDSVLPPMLANELTKKLIKMIDTKFWEAGHLNTQTWYTEATKKLLVALLHPTLSKLELGPMRMHNFRDYAFIFTIPLIYPEVHLLLRLKVLQLEYFYPSEISHDCKGFPPNLEELTVRGFFTDQDLKLAVETCRCLKYLNVSKSKDVTDVSVEHILRIDKLISLDIVETGISELGVAQLLKGLSEKEKGKLPGQKLQHLGISYATTSNLTILENHFTEIRELWLHNDNETNLIPLMHFEKLDSLCLEGLTQSKFLCEELLPMLGERLIFLDLRDCSSVDILKIGTVCKSLKCLHLTDSGSFDDYSGYNSVFLESMEYPGFSTVECLQIELENNATTEFILGECVTVRRLNITLHHTDEYYMLEDMYLRHLEEITWSPSSCISEEFANYLIDNSKNLRIVKGLYINKSSCNYRGVKFIE